LKPQRLDRYMVSNDPEFERKAADVIGLYVNPPAHAAVFDKTTNAAWRTKPTFYAVSTQDRTINPDLERFMAKRMGAKTIEIEASHLALISHPAAITDLILEALAA
jgi:pimeloyl-ACP methyl ester carboxylesterase